MMSGGRRHLWTGCGTALVTPFTTHGAIDEPAVRRLAQRQIDGGVHFLVPCGTTGESPTLTRAEHRRVVEIVVDEANGRLPVMAGAGGYNTQEVIELAAEMKALGADGVLSVTPYYNKPTPEGVYQHFEALAKAVDTPIVVYNVPGRTACHVDVSTLARLAQIPNIVGVKEASGNMASICDVCAAVPRDFVVLSGDDPLTLPMMAVGARGVISVVSNVAPAATARLVEAAERNDYPAARELHERLLPLVRALFIESNPVPVKAAMATMGLLEEVYRLPLVPPSAAAREQIVRVLRELD